MSVVHATTSGKQSCRQCQVVVLECLLSVIQVKVNLSHALIGGRRYLGFCALGGVVVCFEHGLLHHAQRDVEDSQGLLPPRGCVAAEENVANLVQERRHVQNLGVGVVALTQVLHPRHLQRLPKQLQRLVVVAKSELHISGVFQRDKRVAMLGAHRHHVNGKGLFEHVQSLGEHGLAVVHTPELVESVGHLRIVLTGSRRCLLLDGQRFCQQRLRLLVTMELHQHFRLAFENARHFQVQLL